MVNRPDFISEIDFNLLKQKYKSEKKLLRILDKIKHDYPVQYAIGDVEFLNNKILVDKRVLIPRFETELLVYKLISYIEKYELKTARMLDVCTGSGAIAISLKTKFSEAEVHAIDKSYMALSLARKNAKLNNVDIVYKRSDVLKGLTDTRKFSVLVSNPPYVRLGEEVTPNTKYEPKMALYPGEDDLIFYKKILFSCKDLMYPKNIIAFEIGATQAQEICKYARSVYPKANIVVEQDYAGYDRYVFIFNQCE